MKILRSTSDSDKRAWIDRNNRALAVAAKFRRLGMPADRVGRLVRAMTGKVS